MVIIVKISLPFTSAKRLWRFSRGPPSSWGSCDVTGSHSDTLWVAVSFAARTVFVMLRCFTIQIVLSGKPEASFLFGSIIFPMNSEEFTPHKIHLKTQLLLVLVLNCLLWILWVPSLTRGCHMMPLWREWTVFKLSWRLPARSVWNPAGNANHQSNTNAVRLQKAPRFETNLKNRSDKQK